MKKILVVALALVMCFALTAVASAKTYELKISTTQTDSSMIYEGDHLSVFSAWRRGRHD